MENDLQLKARINEWLEGNYPGYNLKLFINWSTTNFDEREDELVEMFMKYFNPDDFVDGTIYLHSSEKLLVSVKRVKGQFLKMNVFTIN